MFYRFTRKSRVLSCHHERMWGIL